MKRRHVSVKVLAVPSPQLAATDTSANLTIHPCVLGISALHLLIAFAAGEVAVLAAGTRLNMAGVGCQPIQHRIRLEAFKVQGQ